MDRTRAPSVGLSGKLRNPLLNNSTLNKSGINQTTLPPLQTNSASSKLTQSTNSFISKTQKETKPSQSTSFTAKTSTYDRTNESICLKELKSTINSLSKLKPVDHTSLSKSKCVESNECSMRATRPNETDSSVSQASFKITSNENIVKKTVDMRELFKRRLNALKQLQMKSAQIEAQFYQELYMLECKYNDLNKPYKLLRKKIINGEHEPNDEESSLVNCGNGDGLNKNDEDDITKTLILLALSKHVQRPGDFVRGIPEFWLSVLKRVYLISQMIEEHDEPILKHLIDLDVELHDKIPYNFTLKFYFSPNDYFHETVLTKTYQFKIEIDANNPFVFEAPETEKSIGCKITWKDGRNVTRVLESDGTVSKLNGEENRKQSFFNFFESLHFESQQKNSLTCEEEAELAIDCEIGYAFKEKVIPRAILYFMGEIIEDENSLEEDDEDEFNQNEQLNE